MERVSPTEHQTGHINLQSDACCLFNRRSLRVPAEPAPGDKPLLEFSITPAYVLNIGVLVSIPGFLISITSELVN